MSKVPLATVCIMCGIVTRRVLPDEEMNPRGYVYFNCHQCNTGQLVHESELRGTNVNDITKYLFENTAAFHQKFRGESLPSLQQTGDALLEEAYELTRELQTLRMLEQRGGSLQSPQIKERIREEMGDVLVTLAGIVYALGESESFLDEAIALAVAKNRGKSHNTHKLEHDDPVNAKIARRDK